MGTGPVTSRRARWVVGIDGSDDSAVALRWAVARATASAAAGTDVEIVAASTWSIPMTTPIGLAGAGAYVDWSDVEQAVADRLDEIVADVGGEVVGDGVRITTTVVQGGAARVLMELAATADLLVVGSRGLAGFKELVLGSVSRQCATHAAVPTVVVPRETAVGDLGRVVVGFDGSANAGAAIEWALGSGHVLGDAALEVVGAFDISPFTDPDVTRARFSDEVYAAEEAFERALDERDPSGRMQRHFSLHGARRALVERGATADLVVVGARGRGAIGAALLGSVTTWLLHHSRCPVVVVPSPPAP